MKLSKKHLALVFVVLVAAFLRLYKLGEIPSGIYIDEAMIGYNAYSILRTGRDEYGMLFPVFLRSFNAYSSPLYVYLSTLPISLFGLSAFSVRVLSALSGIGSVYIVYNILERYKFKHSWTKILGTVVFATSPAAVFFSRAAFEANLAFFLLSVSVFYLLQQTKNQKKFIVAVLIQALCAYSYHSMRLIPILFLPAAVFIYRPKLKTVFLAVLLFFGIMFPQIILSSSPAFRDRAAGLFYSDVVLSQAEKIMFLPNFLAFAVAFIREFFSQLFSYFSPRNLFFLGDQDLQRSIPEMGVFYSWQIVLYVLGFFRVAGMQTSKEIKLLFVMLAIFAIPAALARDPFSMLRASALILPLIIVMSFGIDYVFAKIPGRIFLPSIAIIFVFSLVSFWRSYFVIFPAERATAWGYGYGQLAMEIMRSDEHFVVDTSRVKPPHILLAFHMAFEPNDYQQFAKEKILNGYYDDTDFDNEYVLGNFETRAIDWKKDVYIAQILVGDELAISRNQALEHKLELVFEVRDPLDKLVFQGYRTNPKEKCHASSDNINCI